MKHLTKNKNKKTLAGVMSAVFGLFAAAVTAATIMASPISASAPDRPVPLASGQESFAPSTKFLTENTTEEQTTNAPTTVAPTTVEPTTEEPTTVEPTTEEPTTVEPTTEEFSGNDSDYGYDEYLLARTVYLEAGSCSWECQRLVASATLNLADERGGLAAVVYDYNTFNVAGMIDGCTPSETSLEVARAVINGDRDYDVMFFRTDFYHNFGTPYTDVDNVYFSTY